MSVDDFVDLINELLSDRRYNWASATLRGIEKTVLDTGVATMAQRDAVANIQAARRAQDEGLPTDRYRGSRRYEGF